jgi:hypothetical protein
VRQEGEILVMADYDALEAVVQAPVYSAETVLHSCATSTVNAAPLQIEPYGCHVSAAEWLHCP